jgi:hypothetical protein
MTIVKSKSHSKLLHKIAAATIYKSRIQSKLKGKSAAVVQKVDSNSQLLTDSFDIIKGWQATKIILQELDLQEDEENFCIYLQVLPQVKQIWHTAALVVIM